MEPVRYFLWEVSCGLCCTRWEAASASIYSSFGEHYVQALVMRVSFFWGSFWGSVGGASHISVIVVKFLTVPLNRQIKVLYHGIESISR